MSATAHLRVELESGECREILIPRDHRSLADILANGGFPLNTRCGQRGLCRGCEVELREGSLESNGKVITAPSLIQACQARIAGPVSLYIPARSRAEHRPQVCDAFETVIPYAHQPLFSSAHGLQDTAFAVDIGTTAVVVLLVDLVTGAMLSRTSGFNEQIRFGDNVVTRIQAARDPRVLAEMQHAIVMETVCPLLMRACELAGRSMQRIAGGVVACNTTMLHILVGEDPTPLGIAPFTPRFINTRAVCAAELNLRATNLSPELPIQLLPGIAAYIGSDIVAGIIASGMAYDEAPSLLIDVGTNGEIVLQNNGRLTACATAAGPAFEGSGLSCGARAREGAVSDLHLTLHPFAIDATTIGNTPLSRANGLCGSAYVDFLATARRSGLLSETGRLDAAEWENIPAQFRIDSKGKHSLRLTGANGAGGLKISEVDVALLLQAKAAIGAGIEVLLEEAGMRASDLGNVYLAGGFGMHLNVSNAISIGILPHVRKEQVHVVGNTSLAGAFLALVDRTILEEMKSLQKLVTVVELNLVDGFEDRYVEHLMLP